MEHSNAVFLNNKKKEKKKTKLTYYVQVHCFCILESAAGKSVCLGELVSLTL